MIKEAIFIILILLISSSVSYSSDNICENQCMVKYYSCTEKCDYGKFNDHQKEFYDDLEKFPYQEIQVEYLPKVIKIPSTPLKRSSSTVFMDKYGKKIARGILLILYIIPVFMCGIAAKRKGYNLTLFIIFAFIWTPFMGFIAVIAFPEKKINFIS